MSVPVIPVVLETTLDVGPCTLAGSPASRAAASARSSRRQLIRESMMLGAVGLVPLVVLIIGYIIR
jgi:hypothetical protein